MTKIRIGYACLLTLALGLPAYRQWVVETTVWDPLDLPFPLEPSLLPSTEFTIDRTGTYEVVFKVANSRDPERRALSDCLAGWDWGNAKWGQGARGEPCRVAPVVGLRWRLLSSDGGTQRAGVVEGIADGGGFSNDESYRKITVFSANQGERYRLEGETSLDARALAFAEPRIIVQPTGMNNENEIVTTVGYWFAGGICGVFGLLLLSLDLWRSRRHAV